MAGTTAEKPKRYRRKQTIDIGTPTPSPSELAAAARRAAMFWAFGAIGLVLIYVSYRMEAGPVDELLFGFLTLVAVATGVRQTYANARREARSRARAAVLAASAE